MNVGYSSSGVRAAGLAICMVLAAPAASLAAQGYTPPHVDLSATNYQPIYPADAQSKGEQGSVILNVKVDMSGNPTDINVASSSGFADLDSAATMAVMHWHFLPAKLGSDVQVDWAKVKIDFTKPVTDAAAAPAPAH